MTRLALVLLIVLGGAATAFAETPVARKILGLYDSKNESNRRYSDLHQLAEMPLNWLGFTVEYVDVRKGLPPIESLGPDVRGAVAWFVANHMPNPRGYIDWADALIDSGRKIVLMGESGLSMDADGHPVPLARKNKLLARLGVRAEGENTFLTYSTRIVQMDRAFFEFERQLAGVLPEYDRYRKVDPRARSLLVLRRGGDSATDSHVAVIGPNGAMVAPGYTHYFAAETMRRQWYVDPFALFAEVFGAENVPKPDVTTLSGRRIYFSHVDADGWQNVSNVPPYNKHAMLSSEVVLKEVLRRYPDLPVTVGPIAGDLDPAWHGTKESERIAREMFLEPHVEAGSHTYSHPFHWAFFQDYTPEKEAPYRSAYKRSYRGAFKEGGAESAAHEAGDASKRYAAPRAYGVKPFDMDFEIGGSIEAIGSYLPEGKTVRLLQWSGDTEPIEPAVRRTREANVCNMNGGDARFDAQYPSHSSVPPIGIAVGAERQIYAANSNENTYTDLWTAHFFGYRDLVWTIRNTDSPRRLKPINVYYHIYSGEKLASLNALRSNLDFVRGQAIAPIEASRYCRIAQGFYTTRFVDLGAGRFRVENRGDLQTVRFGGGERRMVDMARSTGVAGQRLFQGELYVALDEAVERPVVALAPRPSIHDATPKADAPYLVEARWRVYRIERDGSRFAFDSQGYGKGAMTWRVGTAGRYDISARRGASELATSVAEADADGLLRFDIDADAIEPLRIAVTRREG